MTVSHKPLSFLCYASEDKPQVDEVYLALRKAGLSAWMDKPPHPYTMDGIRPGEDWNLRIREVISRANYFFAFLSKTSVSKSGYVQREYRMALEAMAELPAERVFLIPVLLEQCELPRLRIQSIDFSQRQWIDLAQDGIRAIVQFLKHSEVAESEYLKHIRHGSLLRLSAGSTSDLANYLGASRIVELSPTEYDLEEVPVRKRRPDGEYQVDRVHDGDQLVFRGLRDCTIVCPYEERAFLYASASYAHVLSFVDCSGVKLKNLRIGHWPEQGHCIGGVLQLVNCSDFTVEDCDLFGCGTDGLSAFDSKRIAFINTTIRDCNAGIALASQCDDLHFDHCTMLRCNGFHGIALRDCSNVRITDSTFLDNSSDDLPIIFNQSQLPVLVERCSFENNKLPVVSGAPRPVIYTDCRWIGNAVLLEAAKSIGPVSSDSLIQDYNWVWQQSFGHR